MKRLLDALFPPGLVCWACELESETNPAGLCARCAAQLRPAGALPAPPGLESLYAGVWYGPVLRAALHRLKYSRRPDIAEGFAALLGDFAAPGCDCILPVPLHAARERARGYNQSALLAHALARRLSLPVQEDALRRLRDTGTQTALTRAQREENMRNAFGAAHGVQGLAILLIDDVATTGSTLAACAHALRAAGAREVHACAACAAPLDGPQPAGGESLQSTT